MPILKMTDLSLKNKTLMIREDFNVPIHNGKITSDARILAALPTIEFAKEAGAKILLVSHLGRPTEGEFNAEFSMQPVADHLSKLLKQKVRVIKDWLDGVDLQPGEIALAENVRFCVGEENDDEQLSKKMANLCDIFVMDAFGVSHRAQSSTHGVARYAKIACAGPLLMAELEALSRAMEDPSKPVVAIVAGSKISTKLKLLKSLEKIADVLIVGGGIANTLLAAKGFPIGKSLYEADLIEEAKQLLSQSSDNQCLIPLPTDVVVAKTFSNDAVATTKSLLDVADDDLILDIGPKTADHFAEILLNAKTIIWNGPVGVFEFSAFSNGTKVIADAIAKSSAFSLAGGGDTIAAIEQFEISDKISYISTGGGAFLSFLEGKKLPAVAILEERGR